LADGLGGIRRYQCISVSAYQRTSVSVYQAVPGRDKRGKGGGWETRRIMAHVHAAQTNQIIPPNFHLSSPQGWSKYGVACFEFIYTGLREVGGAGSILGS
jgi:hypothetical protein